MTAVGCREQAGDGPTSRLNLTQQARVAEEEDIACHVGLGGHVDVDRLPVRQPRHPDAQIGIDSHLELAQPVPADGECFRHVRLVAHEIVL